MATVIAFMAAPIVAAPGSAIAADTAMAPAVTTKTSAQATLRPQAARSAVGALRVALVGVPSGTTPTVRVSGPNGFATKVTGSTVLRRLPRGVYTVAANPVRQPAGSVAVQMSASRVRVVPGTKTRIVVSYQWSVSAAASGVPALAKNQSLEPRSFLASRDGRYLLRNLGTGNLVVRVAATGRTVWSSGTGRRQAPARLIMREDGELALYPVSGGSARWSASTAGKGTTVTIRNDGHVVVSGAGAPVWDSGVNNNKLAAGEALQSGQRLASPDGSHELRQLGSGNLVVVRGEQRVWETNTDGNRGARATMLPNGNLVVTNAAGTPVWSTRTDANPGAWLQLNDDGKLMVTAGGSVLWDRVNGLPAPVEQDDTAARDTIIRRAKSWLSPQVPYSQISYFTNQYGKYRTDCSGYVSMALGLPYSYVTWTLPEVSHRITQSELKPGDFLLDTDDHVLLFAGWANSARTSYYAYESAPYAGGAAYKVIPYPYWPSSSSGPYYPYRLNSLG